MQNITDLTDAEIVTAARIAVNDELPYLGAVLMSLRPCPRPGLSTMAVDAGWRLWYDPETVRRWGVSRKTGTSAVVAHEVGHVIREHFSRCKAGGYAPAAFNHAGDREINHGLVSAGWKFPDTPLLPEQIGMPAGLTAEEYYRLQTDANTDVPGCGGRCGGCAGNAHDWEGAADPKGAPPPLPKWEQTILRRQVAQDIKRHVAAHGQGSVPADLQRWAETFLAPPRIDWKKQLAAFVRSALTSAGGKCDYSWRMPSRRSAGLRRRFGRQAPIMPSTHQPRPDVGICLDVSGSMSDAAAEARSEVLGICLSLGCGAWVYAADTAIAQARQVRTRSDLVRVGETLGGTSMRSALLEIAARRKHGALIVVTDGETDWPAPGELAVPLLVCTTANGQAPPEWIKHVAIPRTVAHV